MASAGRNDREEPCSLRGETTSLLILPRRVPGRLRERVPPLDLLGHEPAEVTVARFTEGGALPRRLHVDGAGGDDTRRVVAAGAALGGEHALLVRGAALLLLLGGLVPLLEVGLHGGVGEEHGHDVAQREQFQGDAAQGRITKAGNTRLRWLLVEVAVRWLRHPRPETQVLRVRAQGIGARGGKKKAVVALARRLAGILFAMMRDGTEYRVPRHPVQKAAAV
jgi:hypothetical protein